MASYEEMIRAHFDAWNARDRDRIVRDLAEDIVLEEEEGFQLAADTYHGHDGAFALWDQLYDVADRASLDVLEIEPLEGDRVLVLLMMHATLRLSGITGSREMAHIWHFREGKAARVQIFGAHEDARAAI